MDLACSRVYTPLLLANAESATREFSLTGPLFRAGMGMDGLPMLDVIEVSRSTLRRLDDWLMGRALLTPVNVDCLPAIGATEGRPNTLDGRANPFADGARVGTTIVGMGGGTKTTIQRHQVLLLALLNEPTEWTNHALQRQVCFRVFAPLMQN